MFFLYQRDPASSRTIWSAPPWQTENSSLKRYVVTVYHVAIVAKQVDIGTAGVLTYDNKLRSTHCIDFLFGTKQKNIFTNLLNTT